MLFSPFMSPGLALEDLGVLGGILLPCVLMFLLGFFGLVVSVCAGFVEVFSEKTIASVEISLVCFSVMYLGLANCSPLPLPQDLTISVNLGGEGLGFFDPLGLPFLSPVLGDPIGLPLEVTCSDSCGAHIMCSHLPGSQGRGAFVS